jgi:hypothetical protein
MSQVIADTYGCSHTMADSSSALFAGEERRDTTSAYAMLSKSNSQPCQSIALTPGLALSRQCSARLNEPLQGSIAAETQLPPAGG